MLPLGCFSPLISNTKYCIALSYSYCAENSNNNTNKFAPNAIPQFVQTLPCLIFLDFWVYPLLYSAFFIKSALGQFKFFSVGFVDEQAIAGIRPTIGDNKLTTNVPDPAAIYPL